MSAPLMQMRDLVRHATLSTLAGVYKLSGQMGAALRRNRVQFLYLHDLPKQDISSFRALLSRLRESHQFLAYSEAVNRVVSGRIDQPYLCVSFDDGLSSCLDAAEVLDEFGIKACFFVCPSLVGETDKRKLAAFCLENLHTTPKEFLSWSDIESLLKGGHEIGSHTTSHRDLAKLSAAEMAGEIGDSFAVLKQNTGEAKHFAWPYGRFNNFSAEALQLVFGTGYQSCASAVRGCHVAGAGDYSNLCVRRDNTVASWPIDHVLYFMARNSQLASAEQNHWPELWQDNSRAVAAGGNL
jgi:peptidoglycan/xylan/chitin deacetylase (PgdA/CDA1 family)